MKKIMRMKKDELLLLGASQEQIETILEYQKKLPILCEGEVGHAVSAHKLHEHLKVKTKFTMWIERKIKKYDFIECVDYLLVSQKRANNNFKNPITIYTDYLVTLDMAIQLQ